MALTRHAGGVAPRPGAVAAAMPHGRAWYAREAIGWLRLGSAELRQLRVGPFATRQLLASCGWRRSRCGHGLEAARFCSMSSSYVSRSFSASTCSSRERTHSAQARLDQASPLVEPWAGVAGRLGRQGEERAVWLAGGGHSVRPPPGREWAEGPEGPGRAARKDRSVGLSRRGSARFSASI